MQLCLLVSVESLPVDFGAVEGPHVFEEEGVLVSDLEVSMVFGDAGVLS